MDSLLVALDCLFLLSLLMFFVEVSCFFFISYLNVVFLKKECAKCIVVRQPTFFFFSYYCAWHLQNITLISAWHTRAKKIRERSQSNDATHIYIQLKWFQSGSWLNWVTWSKRCRVLYPALMKQTCLQQSTPLPILINLLSLWDTVYFCCLFYMVDLCGITICNFLCFFF